MQACNTGWHLCSGVCVSNNASATCGTMNGVDCTPCPEGTACMNGACGVVCGAGTHTCPATSGCFPNDSTLQCGTAASCATCATPADPNAEAVCTTNQCGTACKAGFHRCPAGTGTCVANTAVSSCGTSCTACPAPAANGIAACDNVANPGSLSCRVVCNTPGYCLRGTTAAPTCVSNDTAAACGPSCLTCTAPVNGMVSCDGTACVPRCNADFHMCPNGSCAADTNTTGALCTSACTQCAAGFDCVNNVCTPEP